MLLKCTTCGHNALDSTPDSLRCPSCGATAPLRSGIPIFTEDGDADDLHEMAELVEQLRHTPPQAFQQPADRFWLPNRPMHSARRTSLQVPFSGFRRRYPTLAGKRLLNVSCGAGRESSALLSLGATDITVMDISFEGVAYTQEFLPMLYPEATLNAVVASAEALPFQDNSFELVVVYGSVHHYPSLERFCAEAMRVAPALAVMAEPARLSIQPWLDRLGWNTEYGGIETVRLHEDEVQAIARTLKVSCEVERESLYLPRALDRWGDLPGLGDLWFALLKQLDRLTPDALHHSLNFYLQRR